MKEYCEICGKYLNKDGICIDCGIPTKEMFLKALNQCILPTPTANQEVTK